MHMCVRAMHTVSAALRRTSVRVRPAALLLAGLVLAAAPEVQAQARGTVTGTVTHAQTGMTMSGANIQVIGTQQGTLTRADGSYRLELAPGAYQLRASQVGYATATQSVVVTAGQTATHNFQLAPSAVQIDELVAVGSRRADRTVTNSPVPVDVIPASVIANTGLTETAQIIQRLAPSVNFPRTSIADGTDHLRPVTLRGLAPDQVLVLVNGKRRHNTSLVHVNGTVGRGSTSVDLNAIPASAIERIEVLRDGAAAQYGSDAIAGVVNIVLKGGERQELMTSYGQVFSTENGRDHRDGEVVNVNGTFGVQLGQGGFVTLNGEFRDRQRTNRAYPDARQQYLTGDPRNSNPAEISSWQGDGESRDVGGFLNAAYPLANGVELYAFGGVTQREGRAAGFFRRANDDRTVRSIHPNGFLPWIGSEIWDVSGSGGVRGQLAGWRWDLSSVYGGNSFRFSVHNSNNVSMGPDTPTDFQAGTLTFNQWTNNLDFARELNLGIPVNIGIGAEFRLDRYGIEAGDPDSYRDGGVPLLDANGNPRLDANGNPLKAAVGSQVFPGFRPSDEVDVSRNNVAAYIDLESNLTPQLLLNVAGRTEHYSDFGSTLDGKIAARFEPVRGFALRGAAGSGFRAPSLAQSYFSATSTNFIVVNGVNTPFDIRTFPVDTRGAQILGSRELKPEQSVNLSAGVSLEPLNNLTITADYYAIDIEDRIVLSGNFTGTAIRQLFEREGLAGVAGGRYFTNAVDTRTRGFDVVANYGMLLANGGMLRLVGGYNQSRTRVTRVSETPPELRAFQSVLFDRIERGRIEQGQPRNNVNLTVNYTQGRLGLNVHNQRFGDVSQLASDTTGALDQTFRGKVVTDMDVSYRMLNRVRLSVGANNLFDVYPDEWKDFHRGVDGALTTAGIYRYPGGTAPFGMNGRFVYVRMSYAR
jgi:iron complex outermembrane recepter protein